MKCKCETCQKIFVIDDKYAGKNTNCPNCLNPITIQEYIELEEIKLTSADNNTSVHTLTPWECFWYNVTKNYYNFEGRISRREYWFFQLFSVIFGLIAGLLLSGIGGIIVASGLLLPGMGVTVRRFHDIDMPTIFAVILSILSLLVFLPATATVVIGTIASVIEIIFACAKGDDDKNQYGEPPHA